jgi:hypothetical protein
MQHARFKPRVLSARATPPRDLAVGGMQTGDVEVTRPMEATTAIKYRSGDP